MEESDNRSAGKTLTATEKIAVFFLPNVGDILFLLLIQLPLTMLPKWVFGDGSTGWHLVAGNYILDTHQIPRTDLFSYTHPNAPWVAYEWLADVVMALCVRAGGLNLLAVLVACSVGWLVILLYERCRKEGAHFVLALVLCVITVLLMAISWQARPHLITFFAVYFFTTRLEDFYRSAITHWQLLVPLALFTVLWVNMHPAFLIGFVLLAIYMVSCLMAAILWRKTDKSAAYLEKAKWFGVTTAACALAAIVNPYGLQLFEYIFQYLKGNSILAATDEFLSPVFHGTLQPVCLEILFALLIAGLAFSKRRISFPRVLVCIAFGHLTLSAVRNMPLFAIVCAPVISQLSGAISFGADETVLKWEKLRKQWNEMSAGFDENEKLCNKHVWPVVCCLVLVVAAINGGTLMGTQLLNCGWNAKNKPTVTLEYLRKAETDGKLDSDRGFNYDNWGGYLRYMLGKRVFIDDRADFYGEKFYYTYSVVNMVQPGWQKELDEHKIQWVLIPSNSTLAAALTESAGWKKVSEDEASKLFVRQ